MVASAIKAGLVVKPDSKISKVEELEGKKVGITSAGSGSDILARWTSAARKVNFTRVPLGGGGLVPNLLSGNIDAMVPRGVVEEPLVERQHWKVVGPGGTIAPLALVRRRSPPGCAGDGLGARQRSE